MSQGYDAASPCRSRDMSDPYNLARFVDAQAPVYDDALAELRRGLKTSHWMWFVFPQLHGLGGSPMSRKYGLSSVDEAAAYLRHTTLGPRLLECTRAVNALEGRDIKHVFGFPDYLKFRSCMTLFEVSAADAGVFATALDKHFDGERDARTLGLLEGD